jgi:hypothetical protein
VIRRIVDLLEALTVADVMASVSARRSASPPSAGIGPVMRTLVTLARTVAELLQGSAYSFPPAARLVRVLGITSKTATTP